MIPKADSKIGILSYSTAFHGIGGRIRESPEDFMVSEIISGRAQKAASKKDGYAVYILRKRNVDTAHAISDIWKHRRRRLKPLGMKDSSAVTEQVVCSTKAGRAMEDYEGRRYSLRLLGYASRPLSKGDMIANRFKIRITGSNGEPALFAEYDRVLNFYGYQRFGSGRPVTHLVGKAIVQRNYGEAVSLILSFVSDYDTPESSEIRRALADRSNYQSMVGKLPGGMDTESVVLEEMARHGDPLRSLRAVPLYLRRLYVQAYQSFVFNLTLSAAHASGEDLLAAGQGDVCFDANGMLGKYSSSKGQVLAVPFVGYSYYKKTRFHHWILGVLKEQGIRPGDFYIKELQEASGQGGFRQASIRCTEYGASGNMVEFVLSRGSFATMLLREIIKPEDPIAAGF